MSSEVLAFGIHVKGTFSLTIKREESLRRVRSSQQRMFGDVIVVSTTEAVGGSSRYITSKLANCDYGTAEEYFSNHPHSKGILE